MSGATEQIKTVFFLVLLTGILLLIGSMVGGKFGLVIALGFSLIMNIASYWFSDKIVLSMHKAEPLEETHPVTQIVYELCDKISLPKPTVYVVPNSTPNAFATGRDPHHGAVAVTQGLLSLMNERELRGVLAHELGHIKNRDIFVSTVVACIAGAIMFSVQMLRWLPVSSSSREDRRGLNPVAMLVMIVAAPLVATLIQAAISRSREYLADETGANIAGDPEGLASALEALSGNRAAHMSDADPNASMAQQAFSHMYIVNNFSMGQMSSLFSSHPPAASRIQKLRQMTLA